MIPNNIKEARGLLMEHWQPRMRKCGECGTWHFARVSMSRFKTMVFCSDNCEFEQEDDEYNEYNENERVIPDYRRTKHVFVR